MQANNNEYFFRFNRPQVNRSEFDKLLERIFNLNPFMAFSTKATNPISLTQGKWYDLVIERVVGEELLTKRKQRNELDSNNTVTLSAQTLKIFPNPANNSFHVSVNTVLENNKILLKDAVGKTILEQKIPNNRAELDINTMSLSNGVYFVMIVNQNAVLEVKKIVINH